MPMRLYGEVILHNRKRLRVSLTGAGKCFDSRLRRVVMMSCVFIVLFIEVEVPRTGVKGKWVRVPRGPATVFGEPDSAA